MTTLQKFSLILLLGLPVAFGQDERFIREAFTKKELIKKEDLKKDDSFSFKVLSPIFRIDINSDGKKELIIWENKDGRNWIHIHNIFKVRVASFELVTDGFNSKVYRISVRRISPKTKVLFVYFYEGITTYLNFSATSRVYFITIDNDNLESLSIYKGPAIWEESEFRNSHYHQRNYQLSLVDFNRDGIQEVLVKFNNNSRVYVYTDFSKWKEI